MKKRKPSCIADGDVNWFSHYGRWYGDSNKITIWPNNPTPRHIPWGNPNLKTHVHPNVHWSTISIARIWMSIDRWMDKEAVVHVHNVTFLSHKKECIWVSSNEVDEPRTYYTEWSKSEREREISYTSAYIGEGKWYPTLVLLPEKSHGWRSLIGCSPRGC